MKERLILFLKHLQIGQGRFEKQVGLSNGLINNIREGISTTTLNKIANAYPELNINWLRTGEGEMLKGQEQPTPINPECLYYAPKLPVSAMAGTLEGFTSSINQWDLENIVVPIKGIDLVIPISGDSMKPDYPEGSLLLTKKIDEKAFIEWGKVFVLDTRNGVVIKQVYPGDEESKIKCVSINTAYPSFDVYKSDIFGWYIVLM
ncbi:MAG: S24 family peptidase, partial [Bacteroidales bacterium]|nr:S24 family peptidase [Bacteroidales bacterium]